MRFPRVRFTVRGLMVGVAAVALGLGGWLWAREMGRRSRAAATLASRHRREARMAEIDYRMWLRQWFSWPLARGTDVGTWEDLYRRWGIGLVIHEICWQLWTHSHDRWQMTFRSRRLWNHHDRLRWKWERVARNPWLPAEPDPSEPP